MAKGTRSQPPLPLPMPTKPRISIRVLGFVRWLLTIMVAALLAASQVGPGEAISNLGKWAEVLGIEPIPFILRTKGIDQWVAIGAVLVLLAIGFSWVMEYEILRGYVRQHGGAAAFANVAPRQRRAIIGSLLASMLIVAGIIIITYYEASRPYQLSEQNAYIRIIATVPVYPTAPKHEMVIHFVQKNVGRRDAMRVIHTTNTFHLSQKELSDEDIDEDFEKLVTKLKDELQKTRGATYEVDAESYYSYVVADGDSLLSKIEAGQIRAYIYWVNLYRDNLIPAGAFIATEECVWIMPTHAFQRCPQHNGRRLIR